MFPLLQRYIFREILRTFTFILGCVTVLLVFVGVFQQASEHGMSLQQTLEVLPFIIPSLLPFTIPAAMLLTVTVVYGRLAGDLEVIAAKAAGIHPVSLMAPALLFSVLLSVGSFLLTDRVIPWSWGKIEEHAASLIEEIFLDRLKSEREFYDRRLGLHVTVADVQGSRLIQPIFRYTRGTQDVTLRAAAAEIQLNLQDQLAEVTLHSGYIDVDGQSRVFFQGSRTESLRWSRPDPEPKARHLAVDLINSEMKRITIEQREREHAQVFAAWMSLTQADFERLLATAHTDEVESRRQEYRYYKLHTEIHSRYALACSCFFFTLLGTPFSMRFGKSQFLSNFLLCFTPIVCGYYPLMLGLMQQAKKGFLEPELTMWIANVVVGFAAFIVLRRVIQH